jgi:hypothetical protein
VATSHKNYVLKFINLNFSFRLNNLNDHFTWRPTFLCESSQSNSLNIVQCSDYFTTSEHQWYRVWGTLDAVRFVNWFYLQSPHS